MSSTYDVIPFNNTVPVDSSAGELVLRSIALGYIAGVRACLMEGEELFYLSTQMTSGKNMDEAARRAGYNSTREFKNDVNNSDLVNEVMNENIRFSNINLDVQRRNGKFVVTPTTLVIPGASQMDYAWFWREFIGVMRPTIIVSPHWEYSTGSRYEISDAMEFDCKIVTLDGVELSHDEVRKIMDDHPLE